MSFLNNTILSDDFIWEAITGYIVHRRPGTGGAAFNMCCPMCASLGHSRDKFYRCGVFHSDRGIGLHCFNCHFKTGFSVGYRLGTRMRDFLDRIGVPESEIKAIKLRAMQVAGFVETVERTRPEFQLPSFDAVAMPAGSKSLAQWDAEDCTDENYLDVISYLLARGEVVARASTYYWSADPAYGLNRKLLIPCLHDDRVVGWIGRCIDPVKRKYYTQIPKHFLFNSKSLNCASRKYVFIVEGVFDALVVDGVAALGASLNEQQITWINRCDKIPVVIPDRDLAGASLVEVALKQGWHVAFPNYGGRMWWDADLKDVDEAVRRHGQLYTLQSIIASMTNNPTLIMQRANYHLKVFHETKPERRICS